MIPLHIKKLLQAGEGERLDFKQTISSASKIAKTMVSFANHKGGVLLVGIRDNKTISGVKSEDEKYMLELAAHFYCKPLLEIDLTEHEVEGKTVLEARIPESLEKPCYARDEQGKWWVYVRVQDQCLLASKVTVDVMRRNSGQKPTHIQYTPLEKNILERVRLQGRINLPEVCQAFNISRRRATRILVNLLSIGVLRSHTTEKEEFYTLGDPGGE
jgi:predicted HTH transcriptional regulator